MPANPMQWWADFLAARSHAIRTLRGEGRTFDEITSTLSLHPGQAEAIAATPVTRIVVSDEAYAEHFEVMARAYLKSLPPERRAEVIEKITDGICIHCGSDTPPYCHCQNDE